jgi:hypothetical protein
MANIKINDLISPIQDLSEDELDIQGGYWSSWYHPGSSRHYSREQLRQLYR